MRNTDRSFVLTAKTAPDWLGSFVAALGLLATICVAPVSAGIEVYNQATHISSKHYTSVIPGPYGETFVAVAPHRMISKFDLEGNLLGNFPISSDMFAMPVISFGSAAFGDAALAVPSSHAIEMFDYKSMRKLTEIKGPQDILAAGDRYLMGFRAGVLGHSRGEISVVDLSPNSEQPVRTSQYEVPSLPFFSGLALGLKGTVLIAASPFATTYFDTSDMSKHTGTSVGLALITKADPHSNHLINAYADSLKTFRLEGPINPANDDRPFKLVETSSMSLPTTPREVSYTPSAPTFSVRTDSEFLVFNAADNEVSFRCKHDGTVSSAVSLNDDTFLSAHPKTGITIWKFQGSDHFSNKKTGFGAVPGRCAQLPPHTGHNEKFIPSTR